MVSRVAFLSSQMKAMTIKLDQWTLCEAAGVLEAVGGAVGGAVVTAGGEEKTLPGKYSPRRLSASPPSSIPQPGFPGLQQGHMLRFCFTTET